uniref:CSON000512 protein n=1 Tax=Culicoides sonorensis TaxID=179676 RepID=A0A336MIM9_CULSO
MSQLNHGFDCKIFKGITKGKYCNFQRFCHVNQNHNYYDVLNVKRDCTDKDIRESFVKLSKQHHPDTNTAVKDGSQFSKIMEAYKVLGKTETRAAYDHSLKFNYSYHKPINVEYDGQIFRPNKYGFPDPHAPPRPKEPYYGIKGVKRLPNKTIVLLCLFWAGIGITAQYFAIRHSFTFKRNELEQKSAEISETHLSVRAEAEKFGNKVQLERLKLTLGETE